KDLSENAPFQAAREQCGQLEGRIRELKEVLRSATVIDKKQGVKVSIGDSVVLRDLVSGEEMRYILVSPKEVDPTRGKISSASPIGKAIIGRAQREEVEVEAPGGRLCYLIKQVER
ncbi:GreA/GreB family elongation factor, partial [Dehalococcoidia bacterium]|nr:GreA/GreB family elongation factor [Dehalococcoidia bacterium]